VSDIVGIIRDNFLRLRERVDRATEESGRLAGDVMIVGITKYVDTDKARMLFDAGCQHLGESRPQELERKAEALADAGITWHLVGHLQRNKVARTLCHAQMIHSVDSLRLARAIDRIAGEQSRRVPVLLEVNVSGESAKHGFLPDDLPGEFPGIAALPRLELRGLMCMAGLESNEEQTREEFASLRRLLERLQAELPSGHRFQDLSMGMSRDFEIAIAEGATIVRVGSVLFEGVL
jgi:pyridoxal phosphate enzyme (YggS family)